MNGKQIWEPVVMPDGTAVAKVIRQPSAIPPPEPQGSRERSSLATCSLPVSLVQKVAKHLRTAAAIADQQTSYLTAENFREASNLLRAHLESAESRQPRENVKDEPRP